MDFLRQIDGLKLIFEFLELHTSHEYCLMTDFKQKPVSKIKNTIKYKVFF